MASSEKELKRLKTVIRRLINLALLGKKIKVKGKENFVKRGPNIIIGNHIGSFKDIAVLFKITPRPIFFTSNKMIFSRNEFNFLIRKHLQRHLKKFGLFLDLILNPLKSLFVQFISTNIAKVGTIPVNVHYGKTNVIEKCQEHLEKDRAIVALQGQGRIRKKDPNPYVRHFKRGGAIIAYKLYKNEGISVPVTPLAIYGTQIPFMVPGKIRVKVGHPMYIKDYMKETAEATIENFKNALEARVKTLFFELLN